MSENTGDTTVTRLIRRKEETAARLIAAREAKDWTQKDLAERTGLKLTSITKFEQAQRPVTWEAAEAFQLAFDLPAAWFLDALPVEALPHVCVAAGFRGDPGTMSSGMHTVVPPMAGGSAGKSRREK